jgi:PAS domain S-box-containing protein
MSLSNTQLYQSLFDQNPNAIVSLDEQGKILQANASFSRLLDLPLNDLQGREIAAFFPHAQKTRYLDLVECCFKSDAQVFDLELVAVNGQVRQTHVRAFRARVEDQDVVFCTMTQQSKEKLHEQIAEQREYNFKRNEELLNAIVANADEGIAVSDLDGRFIIYNRAMVELVGVQQTDSETYEWSHIFSIYDPATGLIVPKEELPIVRAMRGEEVRNQLYLIKNPLKGDVYVSISSSTIKDAEGRIIAGMVIDRDITEQINYERNLNAVITELKQSNLRFQYASQAVSDAIWDLNLQTHETYWGEGFRSLFGHEASRMTADEDFWTQYIHPEDMEPTFTSINRALSNPGQLLWEAEFRFKKADGSYATVVDKAIIIRDEQGTATRVIGAIQDVTRARIEEQRLKLLESVVTNTTVAVLIAGIEVIPEVGPKVLYVNEAFTSMTGYLPADVINGSPRILYGERTDPESLRILFQAVAERRSVEMELICYTKIGKEFWGQMMVVPVQESSGRYSHYICLLSDITERKNHEIEKEAFIKGLTQRNKELKQFTYITSHNLRSPLVNLTGLLSLIDNIEVEDEELIAIHDKLKISSESLMSTVHDLMDILHTRDTEFIRVEENSLDEVLSHVRNLLQKALSETNPEIRCNFEVPTIRFHKAYFESIIMNLFTNSIKYRSPTRQLKIEISTRLIDGRVVLTFRDNGIGFDLERHKDRVFGFYQKFHNHPDSKGLGLFLVKSQMEELGGTVDMKSFPDAGTTLTLTFSV